MFVIVPAEVLINQDLAQPLTPKRDESLGANVLQPINVQNTKADTRTDTTKDKKGKQDDKMKDKKNKNVVCEI